MDKPKLIKLSDGNAIPQLGLGVWQADNHQVVNAIHHALDTGYRLFDTSLRFTTMKKASVKHSNRHQFPVMNFLSPQNYGITINPMPVVPY